MSFQFDFVPTIIESSEISESQLMHLIEIANELEQDYVKTSTGVYGKANLEQVKTLRKYLTPFIKIKAAGGIQTRTAAIQYIDAGADRLGVSQYLPLVAI